MLPQARHLKTGSVHACVPPCYCVPHSIIAWVPPLRYCSFGEHIVFVALVSDQGLDDNRKACVLLLFFSFAERIIAFVSLTVLTEQPSKRLRAILIAI